LLLWVFF